jgi:hypothetical protein
MRYGFVGRLVERSAKLAAPAVLFACVLSIAWIGKELVPRLLLAIATGSPDDINKLLLALAGLVGAPFLIWRTWIADRQRHVAQEELYTSLLTKAVELLGTTREERTNVITPRGATEAVIRTVPNTEVRLGAIYALEKLAQDYLPLHWQIMEILCAYVRKNAGPPKPCSEEIRALYAQGRVHPSAFREEAALKPREAKLKCSSLYLT